MFRTAVYLDGGKNILKILKSPIMLKMYRSPCLTRNLANGEPIHGEAEIALSSCDEICGSTGLPRGTVRRVQL